MGSRFYKFATFFITFCLVIFLLHLNTSYSKPVNEGPAVKSLLFQNSTKVGMVGPQIHNDTTRPSINITSPSYPPTVTTGIIKIEGTANDSGTGVSRITASIHVFPFKDNFIEPSSQPLLIPSSGNSIIHWSFPLLINTTGTYRVVIEAKDNAGNLNYAETTINAPIQPENHKLTSSNPPPKIAFVRPTFTEAAYQEHGFYRFYFKYGFPDFGKNISTDLDMFTVKTPKSVPEFVGKNGLRNLTNITSLVPLNGTELSDVSQDVFPHPQSFWMPFINSVRTVIPDATLTVMRDEDVHDGHIFYQGNKTNAFDILLLFHNEYVTQTEYNNLRQFVSDGGTIVFIDANALYAEVHYDEDNHTITLVKGHDWFYGGKVASRSVPERWYNETKEWVGSNYLQDRINNNVTFTNNPFNYTHFEEQYVNNFQDHIVVDYGIRFPSMGYFKDPSLLNKQVASYVLQSGKGKVITLGLTARNLAGNSDFMKFFRNVILPNALCPKFISCNLDNPVSDYTPPNVHIIQPSYPPTITSNNIMINGTAGDFDSGIANVTASISSFPIDDKKPSGLDVHLIDIKNRTSTNWQISLTINDSGSYRVVVKSTDNAGNTNRAETTINAALFEHQDGKNSNVQPRMAFIRPTFTEAANQQHGFFDFYFKYGFPPIGKQITTDLDMLTVHMPKSVSEFPGNDIKNLTDVTSIVPINGTELPDALQNFYPNPQRFWMPFIENIKNAEPDSTLTVMRDEDVHDGHIFLSDMKTNAYDVLLLFHSEYVTQQEYDNLKQFVKNGGTLVFIDGNVFTTEINYNKNTSTISLVKGHDWKFNGKAASRSVPERWYNETKGWVGSNHLIIDSKVNFTNNPFNYTHFEEQFVNNPNDKIIINYGIKFPKNFVEIYQKKEKLPQELTREDIPIENIVVASYTLHHGDGKVIMLGLTGRLLAHNEAFIDFFNNRILSEALCPKFLTCQDKFFYQN